MGFKVKASGPEKAAVLIVGEHPFGEDETRNAPFMGRSGEELTKMLHEAGFLRSDIRFTYACRERPVENKTENLFANATRTKPLVPLLEGMKELRDEILACQPRLIIALGNTALWALTGHNGITKWRGSMLETDRIHMTGEIPPTLLMPTYAPHIIMLQWAFRAIAVHDLTRAQGMLKNGLVIPPYNFHLRPSYETAYEVVDSLQQQAAASPTPLRLAVDIETRLGFIACNGIAWSKHDAICLPSLSSRKPSGYWSAEEDLALYFHVKELLVHPNVEVVGQNFLYDAQYFAKQWGYVPRLKHDTMFMQHVAFAGMQKSLDFLSSMYCEFHQYWKDEGKEWNPKLPEEQLWAYNCKDAVCTWEISFELEKILKQMPGQWELYQFQMRVWEVVLRMMFRGIRIDRKMRDQLTVELFAALQEREQAIYHIVGEPLNTGSSKQMMEFFYDQMKMPIQKHKKTKRPTLDDTALATISNKEPLLRGLIELIQQKRSIGVFLSNFIKKSLDPDGRMRCSFNPAGTETFRFSSSESAFYTGTNLQNIPKGEEDDVRKEAQLFKLPNIRKLFVPDPGFTIIDIDLAGADAQVVAWEANDEKLKAAFRAGIKIHTVNSKDIFGPLAGNDGKNEPYYSRAKAGVHLSNYGGKPRTLSGSLGIPMWEAEKFQERWFHLHPEISEWHARIEHQLQTTRQVSNRFGYRRFYFDRVDALLPEALAWGPQSTVACVTNRALVIIDEHPELRKLRLEALIQVHDSLVLQYPTHNEARVLPLLKSLISIPVPYADPLVIPWGLKTSTKSWGDCAERKDLDANWVARPIVVS